MENGERERAESPRARLLARVRNRSDLHREGLAVLEGVEAVFGENVVEIL